MCAQNRALLDVAMAPGSRNNPRLCLSIPTSPGPLLDTYFTWASVYFKMCVTGQGCGHSLTVWLLAGGWPRGDPGRLHFFGDRILLRRVGRHPAAFLCLPALSAPANSARCFCHHCPCLVPELAGSGTNFALCVLTRTRDCAVPGRRLLHTGGAARASSRTCSGAQRQAVCGCTCPDALLHSVLRCARQAVRGCNCVDALSH